MTAPSAAEDFLAFCEERGISRAFGIRIINMWATSCLNKMGSPSMGNFSNCSVIRDLTKIWEQHFNGKRVPLIRLALENEW